MSSKIFITFILMISILKVMNQNTCTTASTTNRNECFTFSSSDKYCCFTGNGCVWVDKNKLDENYKYDCGISDQNYGKYEFREYHPKSELDIGFQTCGEENPEKKEDCTKYSELNNNCCLFQSSDTKACFAIGRTIDINSVKSNFQIGDKSFEYDCKSFNIILSLYTFLLIGLNLL